MSEPEQPLLVRTFDDMMLREDSDGRTLEGLCVPYDVPATVSDPPDFTPYQEVFRKGAFSRAVKAPHRVWLNFEHKPGISNVLGHGLEFEERDDGLYGRLEIDPGPDGEKALRLHRQEILRSLSVEFKPMTRGRNVDGVVERTSVHLDAVALCRQGAYEQAKVLAIRTDPVIDETERPAPFDPELAKALGRYLPVPDSLTGKENDDEEDDQETE